MYSTEDPVTSISANQGVLKCVFAVHQETKTSFFEISQKERFNLGPKKLTQILGVTYVKGPL